MARKFLHNFYAGTIIKNQSFKNSSCLLSQKIKIMKKIIAMAIAAVSFAACNNAGDTTATVDSSSATTTTITPTETTTSSSATYTAADGDVTYMDKKVRVRKSGEWVDADNDVRLDDGVVVYKNGKVKKDGKEVELHDGEIVNRTGNFFDRSGRAIGNAWDATKEAGKDAGKAIKNTAEKVGDKLEGVVDKNDEDDKKKKIDN